MKQHPNLLLVITGDQGSGDPGQISETFLDQDLNLNFSLQPVGEHNSAIVFRN
jgi:hypothetical protein